MNSQKYNYLIGIWKHPCYSKHNSNNYVCERICSLRKACRQENDLLGRLAAYLVDDSIIIRMIAKKIFDRSEK